MLALMRAERDATYRDDFQANYIPAPKTLPGFPGAQRVGRKTGRARWKDGNGDILE